MNVVLDASALLCYLQQEPGCSLVSDALEHSVISAVNWSEVAQKVASVGINPDNTRNLLLQMGLQITAFNSVHADICAGLWPETKALGLSLADRACLALAIQADWPVLTCDRAWSGLGLDLDIRIIR